MDIAWFIFIFIKFKTYLDYSFIHWIFRYFFILVFDQVYFDKTNSAFNFTLDWGSVTETDASLRSLAGKKTDQNRQNHEIDWKLSSEERKKS